MKNLLLFLIIVTLSLLLGGCGEEVTVEPVAEVKPELEGVSEDEVERREDITYLKGSDTPYTGKVYQLYPNGQKEYEADFWNGKEDGLQTEWYENGQKKEEGIWKNGEQDVLQTRWYENGQKKNEANGKDGKMDGLWSEWYENGQKKVETNYKDGKMDGLVVEWHENGQKKGEATFKDDEPISGKFWNSKGEPVDTYEEAKAE